MLTSRSGSQGHPAPPPPQSIEAVRRRARHRLIGAAVMVLVGVLGFPLLFDTQPRPIAVDIPIEIPSRNPVPSAAPTGASVKPDIQPSSVGAVTAADSLGAREEVIESRPLQSAAVVEPAPEPAPAASRAPAPAAAPKPAAKPEVKPPVKVAEKAPDPVAAKEVKPPASGNERIVVQVGAFAEVQRAREARLKLERAGLKTYTHVAETPQGRRIRVRMGPFATRAEAEKAAARAKALGLPAALLWL
jgi:DedD protein